MCALYQLQRKKITLEPLKMKDYILCNTASIVECAGNSVDLAVCLFGGVIEATEFKSKSDFRF